MIPVAGERFGPYEILGTLGRGGVGEVYRAWDGRLEREVAIKLLHDDYPHMGARERFLIEARAASALNHPNICTIFDIGEKDGAPYLVMELLRGETLKHRIERGGMAAEEIAAFGMETAEALGAAHAVGIVHRDVKPANIMLVRHTDGRVRVKVLDFGLAKIKGTLPGGLPHEEHLTVPGEAVGTVSYMSPEQARGDELDGRSDLFSLGTVMYEMATRRTPFQGSTTPLLFVQLLHEDPEPIREWNEEVPKALEKVIFRLLEKEPGRRYQTAAEAVTAIASALGKPSGAKWRKGAPAPAVPLVRVEEPVARAGLPLRPERRVQGLQVGSGGANRHATPGKGGRVPAWLPVARKAGSGVEGDAIRPIRLVEAGAGEAAPARVVGPSGAEDPVTGERGGEAIAAVADSRAEDRVAAELVGNPEQAHGEGEMLVDVTATRTGESRTAGEGVESEAAREGGGDLDIVKGAEAPAEEEAEPAIRHDAEALGREDGEAPGRQDEAEVPIPEGALGGAPDETKALWPATAEQPELNTTIEYSGGLEPVATFEAEVSDVIAGRVDREVAEWSFSAAGEDQRMTEAVQEPWAYAEEETPPELVEAAVEEIRAQRRRRIWKRRVWWSAAAAGAVIAASLATMWKPASGVLEPGQRVAVAGIENHTGAQMLDGSVAAGLEFALAQNPRIAVVDGESYAASLRALSPDGRPLESATARQAARAAGAAAYLYGEVGPAEEGVHGSGAGYEISVVLRDTASDREFARADAKADRIEEIPDAIDRVAETLTGKLVGGRRAKVGYVPLAREATGSLGALRLYAVGLQAEVEGRDAAALKAYGSAVATDPGFVQALVRISWLAGMEDAAQASAESAERANAVAQGRSPRTAKLAEAALDANSRGDLQAAVAQAKELLAANPKDEAAEVVLARAERLQGRYGDAVSTAQQGLAISPRNASLYSEAELGFLALNRAADATGLIEKASRAGLSRPGFRVLSDYLAGRDEATGADGTADAEVWSGAGVSNEPKELAAKAAFLDNTGDLSDGEESWVRAAEMASGQAGLRGEPAALMARAALNRALAGSCGDALRLAGAIARDASRDADVALRVGVAAGLCGDSELAEGAERMLSGQPGAGVQEIRTALAVGHGDPDLASREARQITGTDRMYLGVYLRSMAELYEQQPEAALAGLQEILAHRGVVSLAGTNLFPVAELAMARAFASAGDRANSMDAYGRFRALWDGAGSQDALWAEASDAAKGVLPRRAVLLARVEPVRSPQLAVDGVAETHVVRTVTARPVTVGMRTRREPLLTGLPESWFAHPAPGQESGDGAPQSGQQRGHTSLE